MALVIMALTILVLPGVIFNVYASDGFKSADPALTCPGGLDVTCQGSITEGCQAVASQCSLNNGLTISFLNQASPFTQLLSGNIFGLFSSLTSNGNANRGPFDANGGGAYYTADCFMFNVLAGNEQNITKNNFAADIKTCTQTNPDRSNMTKANTFIWGNWNFNQLGNSQGTAIPFYHIIANATWGFQCLNQGYWFLSTQTTIGYSTIGCDYYKNSGYSPPANPNTQPVYSFLLAIPCSAPGTGGCKAQTYPTGNSHLQVFIQPEQWDTWDCTNAFTVLTRNEANWYGSQQCWNMETWFVSPHAGSSFNLGLFTPLLTLLLGLVLFLIGTGINIQAGGSALGTGTQVGVGTNTQGTKFAQIIGLALLGWAPLYSEFSTWFTSGLLPFGLDGALTSIASGNGVVALGLTTMFFVGILWQAQSLE
jgi:hypothetical protein